MKTKNETSSKIRVNPFRKIESSRKLGKYDLNDNSFNKNRHYSDRKLLRITFNENQKKKLNKENKKINENSIKIKNSIKSVNIVSIPCINNENIIKWKEILYNHNREFSITQLNENYNYNDDQKILNQKDNGNINSDDLDVIQKDIVRTRSSETKFIKSYTKNLELLIESF